MKAFILLIQILILSSFSLANDLDQFTNLHFQVEGQKRTAALYIPKSYNPSTLLPLITYLHGGGGGGDNQGDAKNKWLQSQPITKEILKHPAKFPCLVLIPRCPKGKFWEPVPSGVLQSPWRKNKF